MCFAGFVRLTLWSHKSDSFVSCLPLPLKRSCESPKGRLMTCCWLVVIILGLKVAEQAVQELTSVRKLLVLTPITGAAGGDMHWTDGSSMSPSNSGTEREGGGSSGHLESCRNVRPGIMMPRNAINLHWVHGGKKQGIHLSTHLFIYFFNIFFLNSHLLSVNQRKGNANRLNTETCIFCKENASGFYTFDRGFWVWHSLRFYTTAVIFFFFFTVHLETKLYLQDTR